MKRDLDEVWNEMQNISDKYGKRMLLVVDNIEVSDDEYLRKLSQLACRILCLDLKEFLNYTTFY